MAGESAMLVARRLRARLSWPLAGDDRPTAPLSQGDPTRRLFWAFATLHVLVWTVVPTLTHPNRPLDMVEMLFWGRNWQLGYAKHPPLPAWLAQATFVVAGGKAWTQYLVAQLGVAASFWAAWRLGRELVGPWPALCAATLLEACSYYNVMTNDLNNSIVLVPLWALATLFLYWALAGDQLRYWAATGALVGLGMLAKYDMATLVLAMLALPLLNARARAALATPGPWLTLAMALLVFAPHAAWIVSNHFMTFTYLVRRAGPAHGWLDHLSNPLEFLSAQLLALLPALLVAWPLWRDRLNRQVLRTTTAGQGDTLKRDYLLVVCFGPCALDVALSIVTGLKPQSMWGAPMWTFSALALCFFIAPAASPAICQRVLRRCAVAGAVRRAGRGPQHRPALHEGQGIAGSLSGRRVDRRRRRPLAAGSRRRAARRGRRLLVAGSQRGLASRARSHGVRFPAARL